MLGKSILYVKEDAVAWVTLNRPQAQNRLDPAYVQRDT